jgi:hypothetical protein
MGVTFTRTKTFMLLIAVAAATGSPCAAQDRDGADFRRIAGSGRIAVWADASSGLLRVTDVKSGFVWESGTSETSRLNPYWRTAYRSAFIIQYVDDSGEVKTAFSGQADCRKRFEASPSRGSVQFAFTEPNIAFTAVYELEPDDSVLVTIPYRLIRDADDRLLDIRVLPYFGSLAYKSEGYLVLPDGCGGIVGTGHPTGAYLPKKVYGERFRWDMDGQGSRVTRLPSYSDSGDPYLDFPIFGAVSGSQAFLGVIGGGQFQAEIGTEVTPINLRTSASPRLLYREMLYDMFGGRHASSVLDTGDRSVHYRFLSGKDASYVGIAKLYRGILRGTGGAQGTDIMSGYRLRLFMGVLEDYLTTTRMVTLTTFARAQSIMQDLYDHGVRDLRVNLVGWTSDGYLGDNPLLFPADRRFGGMSGLKSLLEKGAKLGYPVGLALDTTYSFLGSRGFDRRATVKDIQGVQVDVGSARTEYLMCPQIGWDRFLSTDLPAIRDLGVRGDVLFGGINDGLFDCFDKQHTVGRAETASLIDGALRTVAAEGPVAVTSFSAYVSGSVSAVYDAHTKTSAQCDSAIPFTPIILHGWIPYSFGPLNLRREGRREFLKMVEYGAVPNAFLTGETVEELAYARYNPLFSSKYEDWRAGMLEEYDRYENGLKRLQSLSIVDYTRLSNDVAMTVYDDGTRTIVNYGQTAFTYGSTKIDALDYAIVR